MKGIFGAYASIFAGGARAPATINRGRLCPICQLETDWTADQGDQEAHLVIINKIGQSKVAGRRPGRSATRCKKVTCCV